MTSTPVLLVIFNRPELTRRSFERIRAARPSRLYVVADGPRPDRPGERELCERARAEVTVDWPCEVVRDFATENLGCKRRVSSGITAALEREERVIVIEDDCVADPSFFPYCDELLVRYADDPRVMAISGDNFQRGRQAGDASYYFSRYPHCWGWATWRRAWRCYDPALRAWPRLRRTGWLERELGSRSAVDHWTQIFDAAHGGAVDSWAYPWTFSCWSHGGLTGLPAVNLVTNIGFGPGATHTADAKDGAATLKAERLTFPLRHPTEVVRDVAADALTQATHFEGRPARLRDRLRARVAGPVLAALQRARARARGDALGALAALRDAPRRVPGTAVFRGHHLAYEDAPSFYWQLQEIFVDGCYDVDVQSPRPRVLDIGGNVGMATLRFRELLPDARISVFEADPRLAATLERNIRATGDLDTEVVARAVWTHDGAVAFSGAGDDAGRVDPTAARRVPCVDIAALCREPVDLAKIDVEGGEHELLERLVETGTIQNVRRLVIECHQRGVAPPRLDQLLGRLAAAGLEYRVLRAREHAGLDPTPAASGFSAARSRGWLGLVYAWRADERAAP